MANKGFVEFRELSKTSKKIQDKLKGGRDEAAIAALAVKVGAEEGYRFSAGDVLAWNKSHNELSDAQLSAVQGGVLIGGGAKQEPKTFADYWYAIFYA